MPTLITKHAFLNSITNVNLKTEFDVKIYNNYDSSTIKSIFINILIYQSYREGNYQREKIK